MIVVNYLVAGAGFCLGLYAVLTRRDVIKIVVTRRTRVAAGCTDSCCSHRGAVI